jgi:prepilin-type N-terminal cleavage/methylation domain-containing protein
MRKGFTLIELLLVVVIIGIIAALVLPKFGDVKSKAYVAAMKSDLRNLATAQEIEFEENGSYFADFTSVAASDNITLGYIGAPTEGGYVASAKHGKVSQVCVLNRTNAALDATTGAYVDGALTADFAGLGAGAMTCKAVS